MNFRRKNWIVVGALSVLAVTVVTVMALYTRVTPVKPSPEGVVGATVSR